MRQRRTEEQMVAETSPIMYRKSDLHCQDRIRGSFPDWDGAAHFDYRNGWTQMGEFYADGYFLREEMRELVHNRFGVNI